MKSGYGKIKYQQKYYSVHRLIYEYYKGDIPDGLFVCHTCDNPSCMNPDHLFLGTCKENIRDSVKKGRHSSVKPKKISQKQKQEISYLYSLGLSQTDISKKYDCSQVRISQIIREINC